MTDLGHLIEAILLGDDVDGARNVAELEIGLETLLVDHGALTV